MFRPQEVLFTHMIGISLPKGVQYFFHGGASNKRNSFLCKNFCSHQLKKYFSHCTFCHSKAEQDSTTGLVFLFKKIFPHLKICFINSKVCLPKRKKWKRCFTSEKNILSPMFRKILYLQQRGAHVPAEGGFIS